MAAKTPAEVEPVALRRPHRDRSGLRARLKGEVVEERSIVADLRAAMAERENNIIDISDGTHSDH